MNKSGYVIVKKGPHKVGLVDTSGNEVLPCIYDKVLDYDDDGYIRFMKGEVYGTIDFNGNILIPLEYGLTHLGVFHDGTARAQKDGLWGLVNEKGKPVVDFQYKSMNAYYDGTYKVTTLEGKRAYITPHGKQRLKLKSIATYHNDVAPALLKEGGWVFVNRVQERINAYLYWSMDPVLRNGIYHVAKKQNQYGMADYTGKPIVDEWFDYPFEFCNGLARVQRKNLKEDGSEIRLPNGQPEYLYGIINENGQFLFPMVYTSMHWNDFQQKDCWYAEDDKASYLLFPDGSRRIYNHRSRRSRDLLYDTRCYIPRSEYDNNISEADLLNEPKVRIVETYHPRVFDMDSFIDRINWWAFNIPYFTAGGYYYRDTDMPIPTDSYQKGQIIRSGMFLEATQKLRCPLHKTRFVILSRGIVKVENLKQVARPRRMRVPFRESIINPNDYFLVTDIYKQAGITQIMLLQLPYGAIKMANEIGLSGEELLARLDLEEEIEETHHDLHVKLTQPAHGYSLSDEWTEAMRHPIGLDTEMHLFDLEPEENTIENKLASNEIYNNYRTHKLENIWYDWQKRNFSRKSEHTLKLAVGDIMTLNVDVIIGTDGISGKLLVKGVQPNSQRVVDITVPVWQDGKHNETELLANCYEGVLCSYEDRCESIAFPLLGTGSYGFPIEQAADVAYHTIMECLEEKLYEGDVIICCGNYEEVAVFQKISK